MKEKTNNEWNFQKIGKPYDELPNEVKRNPELLYEYIRTGEIPNINSNNIINPSEEVLKASKENLEKLIKKDTEDAMKIIDFAKRNGHSFFMRTATKNDLTIKEYYDEYFIESGYYKELFDFNELPSDITHFSVTEGPDSLIKVESEVEQAIKINKIYFSAKILENQYANALWGEILTRIAEDRLKELEEYKQ